MSNAASRAFMAIVAAALLMGGAFLLYQPALRIGLLSDDYALLMWARRLELAPIDWGQIRPIPILSWWLVADLTQAGRTPAGLHGLNIALHGLNAVLVWALARRLTASEWAAACAGAVFVTLPTSVEPVAWASGVFDVTLTTCALLMTLMVTSRQTLRPRDYGLCLLFTVGMMGAKETGVIAAPLALLVYWTRWSRVSRGAIGLAAAQLLLAGTYTVARELTGRLDHRLVPTPTIRGIGRLITGTLRAFFLPLHRDVIAAHPLFAILVVVILIAVIAAWIGRWRADSNGPRLAALAGLGMLISVAPAIRLFGVAPDLQGTRYVYLASAWWSIAIGAALLDGWQRVATRRVATGVAVLAIATAAVLTRIHLGPWTAARVERDRVLLRLISLPPSCQQAAATGVPDNVAGAYVFRNGLNEALATLGRSFEWVDAERAAPECRVDVSGEAAGPTGRS